MGNGNGKATKGLSTLAYLKSQLDQGRDHLSMFEPVVADAVSSHPNRDFATSEVRSHILLRTGISVPTAYVETLLRRMVRDGRVEKSGGRYTRLTAGDAVSDYASLRETYSSDLTKLGAEFSRYVTKREPDQPSISGEEGLELLADFVRDRRVELMLAEPVELDPGLNTMGARRLGRHVARFISEECLVSDTLRPILKGLVEGMVLQDVLLLRDVANPEQRFKNLTVVLDTHVLLAHLGLLGSANELAASEGIAVLRECGARVIVFPDTLDEISGILKVYEDRLGTTEGRLALHPTALTQHMFQERMSPADIRYFRSTLTQRVQEKYVVLSERPGRDPRYTLDERGLDDMG